ncbi:uncharacterized protein LOC128722679 [Anopheles nili]|uniref:uncharacterized protein LOC128722679 n=1 Tax=Anopheles nili TaxID=185578 RepID=UPI00237BFBC1|nr:uncharacterized protein LOC128722679 [Anopheles nili]
MDTELALYNVVCKGCKLIKYCSVQHQKLDAPSHDEFCLSVQAVTTKLKVDHIVRCPEKMYLEHLSTFASDKRSLKRLVDCNRFLIERVLNRSLLYHEHIMVQFLTVCNVCLNYDSEKLDFCSDCRQVAYCSEEHRQRDRENHSKWCDLLRINFCLDFGKFIFKCDSFIRLIGDKVDLQFLPKDSFQLASEIMGRNIKARSRSVSKSGLTIELPQEMDNIKLASHFSWVGTILYALKCTDMYDDLQDDLVVFIIGTDNEDVFFNRLTNTAFFVFIPMLRRLRLYFIGPNLKQNDGYQNYLDETRVVEAVLYRDLYHKLPQKYELPNPHLIIAFNCGFHEFCGTPEETWSETIRNLLCIPNVPFAFTSYTHEEAVNDATTVLREAQMLDKRDALTYVLRAAVNPLRNPDPIRNPDLTDETDVLYHKNGYLSIAIMRKE